MSDPAGIRTQDPYIKSVMLYRLSYGIVNLLLMLEPSRVSEISLAGHDFKELLVLGLQI